MHEFNYEPERKEEILDLIYEGEGLNLDFKFAINDARKIAKTLSAFANTNGGRLLIGVKDNGRISGIDPEEEAHMISSAAEIYCEPAVPYALIVHDFDGKTVLEVSIEQGPLRPYLVKEKEGKPLAYFRFKDHTIPANGVLLAQWKVIPKAPEKSFAFSVSERAILAGLEDEPLSFSQLKKRAQKSLSETTEILARLLAWKIILLDWSKEGFTYRLNPNPAYSKTDAPK